MCRNLARKSGMPVMGLDRDAAPMQRLAADGVAAAASVAEVARGCDVIFLSLPSGEIVDAIARQADGLLATFEGDKAPPPTVTTQSVDEFAYSQTDTGAEVTFKQFGADYLVQFECKKPDETKPCITEAEARGVVESLVMVGN